MLSHQLMDEKWKDSIDEVNNTSPKTNVTFVIATCSAKSNAKQPSHIH